MVRQAEKKHRKAVERRRRIADRTRHAERRRLTTVRGDRYPAFEFEGHADPEFERLIRRAAASIDFANSQAFSPGERLVYRLVRAAGAEAAMAALGAAEEQVQRAGDPTGRFMTAVWSLNLGSQVFLKAGADLDPYLPMNDVQFLPRGDRIVGVFRRLESRRTATGTVFFSPHQPTVDVDGRPRVVGFSRHAIEMICDRMNPRWRTYAGLGDVFGTLHDGVGYEPCELLGGQPAFTFFDRCGDDLFSQHEYVRQVLGTDRADPAAGPPYYRVGYCPAVDDGEFFKAKTFLMPGYSKTPEHGLIGAAGLPREERERLRAAASAISNQGVLFGRDLETIRWFHDHGVPQVIQTRRPMFAESPERRQVRVIVRSRPAPR